MSLILEALRRSEAERRRTQVPDLLAPPEPTPRLPEAAVARRRAGAWLGLAAAVALVAIAAWLGRATTAPAAQATDAAHPSPGAPATTVAARPAPTRVTGAPPGPAAAPPGTGRAGTLAPLGVAAAPPRLVIAPPPAPAAPTTDPRGADAAAPTAVAREVRAPAPLPAAPAPPPAATAPPPAATAVLRVDALPPAQRGELPPLKLTLHMWNEAPERRFVVLDGSRLVVGDRIGPLAITDIVRDGVLLDWNGTALKLPLR